MIDDHGQPNPNFNLSRRLNRSTDELMGLCKGLAADGVIVQAEAEYLLQWLEANAEIVEQYPVNYLYARIGEMLEDGVLDKDEQAELLSIIKEICGNDAVCDLSLGNLSSSFPLDKPMPEIDFDGSLFLFTGRFAYGPRKSCIATVEALGGEAASSVVQKLDYLVIGTFSSADWIHTNYGRKIEKAVAYRDEKGLPLAIISEQHWLEHVERLTIA